MELPQTLYFHVKPNRYLGRSPQWRTFGVGVCTKPLPFARRVIDQSSAEGARLARGQLHTHFILSETALARPHSRTGSRATPGSGHAFPGSTFTGEGGTRLIFPSRPPTSFLLSRSPPLAPAVCKLPVWPTPPGGCSPFFPAPVPSVLSPLALSEQMHLLFLGFLSAPPRPPAPPTCPRLSSPLLPPPRGALTLRSRLSGSRRRASVPGRVSGRPPRSRQSRWEERSRERRAAVAAGRARPSRGDPEESESASGRRARRAGAVAASASERRPSHCSLSPSSCARGPQRPSADLRQRGTGEIRNRERGRVSREMRRLSRWRNKAACRGKPAPAARAQRLRAASSRPRAHGPRGGSWGAGRAPDSPFGWDKKVVLAHVFCQVVVRSAWLEPRCHSPDLPR